MDTNNGQYQIWKSSGHPQLTCANKYLKLHIWFTKHICKHVTYSFAFNLYTDRPKLSYAQLSIFLSIFISVFVFAFGFVFLIMSKGDPDRPSQADVCSQICPNPLPSFTLWRLHRASLWQYLFHIQIHIFIWVWFCITPKSAPIPFHQNQFIEKFSINFSISLSGFAMTPQSH